MALNIPEFDNGYRLLDIRTKSLNPVIKAAKALDVKVEGLQTVVALSMTEPSIDVTNQRLVFKEGGKDPKYVELGPLLNTMKHGIDISTPTSAGYTDVSKINFKNATLHKNGDVVDVDFNPVEGQVDSGVTKQLKKVFITGNTAGSSMTADGIMTINMPSNSISAKVNGNGFANIDKIAVVDTSGASEVTRDTLTIKIPDPIKGKLLGGSEVDLKSIDFIGNIGNSRENDGNMVIELPMMQGEVSNDPGLSHIKEIKVKGNIGSSKVEGETLTIDLPVGGGGGTANPLKVGENHKNPIENVEEIYFEGSEVKVATTRSGTKVLVTPRGFPVEKEGETAKMVKQIKLTGDVESSTVSDTGLLTLNIPNHEGLTVSDGGSISSKGITTLEFKDSEVVIESSGAAKATVTPKLVAGFMGGKEEPVREIEVTGTLGSSTLSGGRLKIDLPAGGGGTGGADITGIVGSDSAKIERIEIIGENKYNSKVDATTKTLTIDTPRKVSIKGGADVFSDVDIVEVANSTVQLDTAGGKRKAFITPHIPFMAEGWFPTMEALNSYIPLGARIPTKTYGFVPDPVTRENVLWIWLPNLTTGVNDWVAMPVAGSLFEMSRGTKTRSIYGVDKNPMVNVSPDGVVTITDTTVPEVICETLSQDGMTTIKKGKFNELRFEDGEGVVSFDTTALDLKVHRAQRRLAMGNSAAIEASAYTSEDYEGSIWLNKTDDSWWGYNDKDVSGGEAKWTKIIHRGMSGEVSNLSKRVPQIIPSLTVTTTNGDHKDWAESGWTHLPKESVGLPEEIRQKTGGYIETFVIWDASVPGFHHRYQMVHVETDAATYKRYWKFDTSNWSDWVKTSFNPLELKAHNEDPHAHAKTNPFYKVLAIDCLYSDIYGSSNMIPNKKFRLLATSNGMHKNEGHIVEMPYDGTYNCRGHVYFHHEGSSSNVTTGVWTLELFKRGSAGGALTEIAKQTYTHGSTTLLYPPLKWDIKDLNLEKGDSIQMAITFQPSSGSVADWLKKYPNLGFLGGRSYVSFDIQGNDAGNAIGETFRTVYGTYVATGDAGVISTHDPKKPTEAVRVVGTKIEPTISIFG